MYKPCPVIEHYTGLPANVCACRWWQRRKRRSVYFGFVQGSKCGRVWFILLVIPIIKPNIYTQ